MNQDYIIHCENLNEFIAVCTGLVQSGILFEAKTKTLSIHCTGGY